MKIINDLISASILVFCLWMLLPIYTASLFLMVILSIRICTAHQHFVQEILGY